MDKYYLSQICCFCLRKNENLEQLHEIIHNDTPLIDVIKITIREIEFPEPIHGYSICHDCVNRVEEMYTFRQTSIANNRLLTEYCQSGGEFGNVPVRVKDITERTGPAVVSYRNTSRINNITSGVNREEYENCERSLLENEIKVETEGSDEKDPLEINDYVGTSCGTENIATDDSYKGVKTEPGDFADGDVSEYSEEFVGASTNNAPVDDFNGNDNQTATEVTTVKMEIREDFTETFGNVSKHGTELIVTKPFECKTCKKSYSQAHHFKNHSCEKSHKCETCGKSYSCKRSLYEHNLKHTGEQPYKCKTCNKIFSHRGSLANHAATHTDEKLPRCETCGKYFSCKRSLNEHCLIHTGEQPYKCKTCNKTFSNRGSLTNHTATHTDERPFACGTCGKSFVQISVLRKHNLTHTGEQPYKCNICNKTFSQGGSLRNHSVTHSDEKPHKCDTCGKSFRLKQILTTHMLIHSDEKKHKCGQCGRLFLRKSDLTSHYRIHEKRKINMNDGK